MLGDVDVVSLGSLVTGPGEFNIDDWVDKRDKRTQGVNYIAYALSAAEQALEESGVLRSKHFDPHRSVRH